MTNMSNSNLKTDDKKIMKDRQVLGVIRNFKKELSTDVICPSEIQYAVMGETLDKNTLWALYQITSNFDINEDDFCYLHDTLVNFEFTDENVKSEINNLITRFKIRELRLNGFITKDDETALMSRLQETYLTYEFFDDDEIEEWKSKAFHYFTKLNKKEV